MSRHSQAENGSLSAFSCTPESVLPLSVRRSVGPVNSAFQTLEFADGGSSAYGPYSISISKQQARIAELELKNTKLSDAALCAVDDETQRRLELVRLIAHDRCLQRGDRPTFCCWMQVEAENAVLGKEVESKNKELDKLSHVVAVLESKVGRGDFDARTTKVLHLGLNPEKQKLDEREALRLEEASKKTDSWEQLAERRAQVRNSVQKKK